MNILALDCSSFSVSVCVSNDDKILFSSFFNKKRTHSETLMTQIEYALTQAELNICDIDVYGVTVGPGSYTGLRIGTATIKALAHANSKPVSAISTLKALSINALPGSSYICPIIDARNDQIYSAVYENKNLILSQIISDSPFEINEFISEIKKLELNNQMVFVGDGAVLHSDKIKSAFGNKAVITDGYASIIDAKNVEYLTRSNAINDNLISYMELEPVYLRKPQAERELKINGKQ